MASYTTSPLSGSTNGRPIGVIATVSPGTTLHTVSTATAVKEFPYIFAHNYATVVRQITIEFGSTASNAAIVFKVPPQDGLFPILPGAVLVGATGQEIRAFATATDGLAVVGYSDRAS